MPEQSNDRTWDLLRAQLDRIESKLDRKVDYLAFAEFKTDTNRQIESIERETTERFDSIDDELQALHRAAITPDQVTKMLAEKLQEEDARVVTHHDRWVRYAVAAATLATFILLIYTTFDGQ